MVNLANDAIGYIIPKSEWDGSALDLWRKRRNLWGNSFLGEETGPTLHRHLLKLFSPARATVPTARRPLAFFPKFPRGRHTTLEAPLPSRDAPSKTPHEPKTECPSAYPQARLKGKGRQPNPPWTGMNAMEEDAPPNEEHGDGPKNGQETHEPWRERQDPRPRVCASDDRSVRQGKAEVIKLNDRGDQAINSDRRNDCHDRKYDGSREQSDRLHRAQRNHNNFGGKDKTIGANRPLI